MAVLFEKGDDLRLRFIRLDLPAILMKIRRNVTILFRHPLHAFAQLAHFPRLRNFRFPGDGSQDEAPTVVKSNNATLKRHDRCGLRHYRGQNVIEIQSGSNFLRNFQQSIEGVNLSLGLQQVCVVQCHCGLFADTGEEKQVVFIEQRAVFLVNYLDHAEAYVNKTKVRDRNTKEELAADEGFLKSIEEQIAIIGSAADGFRQEVIAYLWATSRRGEKVSYKSYEPLKEAIEKKLMTSVRDISRIITKARTRDEEQSTKYSSMVQNLLENGYCESCVDVVLKYAANNLWKD